MSLLPQDAQERKRCPVYSGVLKYFPDALVAVARCSQDGNDQHHPDKPLHWDKSKSADEMDALMRHAIEGEWESVCWRALANLQREIDGGYVPKSFMPTTVEATGSRVALEFEDWEKSLIGEWRYSCKTKEERYDSYLDEFDTTKDLPKPLSQNGWCRDRGWIFHNGQWSKGGCVDMPMGAMLAMYEEYLKDFNANNEQPKEDGSA